MKRRARSIAVGIVCGVVILWLGFTLPFPGQPPTEFGVTFSQTQATGLGLPWREVYQSLLVELGVRRLRLIAYWPLIEPAPEQYAFTDLDYQLDQAAAYGGTVTLALGRKVPRWPECHVPEWARSLEEDAQQQHVLQTIEALVERYRDHRALVRWQVENEPFLDFGVCPPFDRAFFAREVALVQELDPLHPILITDSGELNSWLPAAKFGDELGTTMYRTVFSARTKKPFHYDYIFPAWLYRAKARLVYLVRGKPVIIAELQGEPWGERPWGEMTPAERFDLISPARLKTIAAFAKRTQLPEAYWWGSEYWYWEREQGNPALWDLVQDFF